MLRNPNALTLLTILAAMLAVGCRAGTIRGPGVEDPDTMIADPEEFFRAEVEPILMTACAGCHTDPVASQGAVFLSSADYYASVTNYVSPTAGPLITPGEGAVSLLVTKGMHRGPELAPEESTTIRRWIDAEGEAPPPPPPPPMTLRTSPRVVMIGATPEVNTIPLDEVGLPGSSLIFGANTGASGITLLTDVRLSAGEGGMMVTQPVLVVYGTDNQPVSERAMCVDDLSCIEFGEDPTIAPGFERTLGGTWPVMVPAGGQVVVEFDTVALNPS